MAKTAALEAWREGDTAWGRFTVTDGGELVEYLVSTPLAGANGKTKPVPQLRAELRDGLKAQRQVGRRGLLVREDLSQVSGDVIVDD